MQALFPRPQLLYHCYWLQPGRLPGTRPVQGVCFKRAQQVSQAPAYLRNDLISRSHSLPGFPDTLISNRERERGPRGINQGGQARKRRDNRAGAGRGVSNHLANERLFSL